MLKYGDYTIKSVNNKTVSVQVNPPCISSNREYQYIFEALKAYQNNSLAENMQLVENAENIVIIYNR